MTLEQFESLKVGDIVHITKAEYADGPIIMIDMVVTRVDHIANRLYACDRGTDIESMYGYEFVYRTNIEAAEVAGHLLFDRTTGGWSLSARSVRDAATKKRELLRGLDTRNRMIATVAFDDLLREYLTSRATEP